MVSFFKEFLNKGKNRESDGEVVYTNEPTESETQKVRIVISGRVQGVGFRFSTKQVADELDIRGIVKNESDGTVYVEAAGDKDSLSQFIEALRKGPSHAATVHEVSVTFDENIEENSTFSQAN